MWVPCGRDERSDDRPGADGSPRSPSGVPAVRPALSGWSPAKRRAGRNAPWGWSERRHPAGRQGGGSGRADRDRRGGSGALRRGLPEERPDHQLADPRRRGRRPRSAAVSACSVVAGATRLDTTARRRTSTAGSTTPRASRGPSSCSRPDRRSRESSRRTTRHSSRRRRHSPVSTPRLGSISFRRSSPRCSSSCRPCGSSCGAEGAPRDPSAT